MMMTGRRTSSRSGSPSKATASCSTPIRGRARPATSAAIPRCPLHHRPAAPECDGQIRGRVVEVVDDDRASAVIDQLSVKYAGRPYPEHVDRMLFEVEPEQAWAQEFT
jgi:hypothetical protein